MVARTRKASSSSTVRTSRTLRNAANSGDRRRLLVAMRNLIADRLDKGDVAPRDLSSLVKRLSDLSEAIDRIDKAAATNDPVSRALDTEDELFDPIDDGPQN
ncbi:MAG: hypothetical protein E7D48_04125 [Bifidobacterium scardovii]|uniref:hypothetical protein n=1 Tax=Bifidobacterium scardovii TaxID=158787 RepID=UPI00206BFB7A|nr:hypothetical protein [Bifidobacterium scardovii]MDU2421288.1 hypothetical protein [Bifidobacterium scardovii]DAZ29445.1 MAG TPA: hypothetical protein [Caudoviricetes sp.]